MAACKDECSAKLSDFGKRWFKNMGSKEIEKLEYRQGFAFIASGGKTVLEKRATHYLKAAEVT